MTYPPFSENPSGDIISVQLHYDHLSRTAHAWSSVFDGVLPSRYPTREAAADAARAVIATIVSKDDENAPRREIRIWLR